MNNVIFDSSNATFFEFFFFEWIGIYYVVICCVVIVFRKQIVNNATKSARKYVKLSIRILGVVAVAIFFDTTYAFWSKKSAIGECLISKCFTIKPGAVSNIS